MPPKAKPLNEVAEAQSTSAETPATETPAHTATAVAPAAPPTKTPKKALEDTFGPRNARRIAIATELYCAMMRANPNYVGVPNQPWVRAAYAHADAILAFGEAEPVKE